jgi:hypothetical protein
MTSSSSGAGFTYGVPLTLRPQYLMCPECGRQYGATEMHACSRGSGQVDVSELQKTLNSTQAIVLQAQQRADKLLQQNTQLVDKIAERDELIDALRQKVAILEDLVKSMS